MALDGVTAGEVWAIALSEDGRYLASTTYNGRINVWDTIAGDGGKKIREYETKKSFGLAIDLVSFRPIILPFKVLLGIGGGESCCIELSSWSHVQLHSL